MRLLFASVACAASATGAACGGKAVIDVTGDAAGAGGGALAITLSDVQVFVACMPAVPSDPVSVTFSAKYVNGSSASASASIAGATISLGGPPSTLDWSFAVSPADVGPIAGLGSANVDHAKEPNSGSGSGSPCNFCSAPAALLSVDYVVDGAHAVNAAGSGPVSCSK